MIGEIAGALGGIGLIALIMWYCDKGVQEQPRRGDKH
jgi:hypothetical protein